MLNLEQYKIYQGVDLIGGIKKKGMKIVVKSSASWFVDMTVGIDTRGNRHVLNIERHRGLTFSDQVKLIKKERKKFHPILIGIEDNAAQNWMVSYLIETTDCPIRGFTTTSNKHDPEMGIPALALEFENGKWVLPYGNAKTIKLVDLFVNELKSYPVGKTFDLVMAAWFCKRAYDSMTKNDNVLKRVDKFLEESEKGDDDMNIYDAVASGDWSKW